MTGMDRENAAAGEAANTREKDGTAYPLRRIRLTVAYDGTNYNGWQYQPNGITIEEVLNEAI